MTGTNGPSPDPPAELESRQSGLLRTALSSSDISVSELWLRYLSIGGNAGEYEVEAYVHSLLSLPVIQRDLLARAANELIDELPPPPRAPVMDDLYRPGDSGPTRPRPL